MHASGSGFGKYYCLEILNHQLDFRFMMWYVDMSTCGWDAARCFPGKISPQSLAVSLKIIIAFSYDCGTKLAVRDKGS